MSCGVTLVDKEWLCQHVPDEKILKMLVFLKVRGIRASKHELDKFLLISIDFLGFDEHKQPVYARIYREMHLVDGLKANILVENDIIAPEDIMIDLANSTTFITSYNVRIAITARQKGQPLRKKSMADIMVSLLPNSEYLIPVIHGTLPCNRDFFF